MVRLITAFQGNGHEPTIEMNTPYTVWAFVLGKTSGQAGRMTISVEGDPMILPGATVGGLAKVVSCVLQVEFAMRVI